MAVEEQNNQENQTLFEGFDFTAMQNMASLIENNEPQEIDDEGVQSSAQEENDQDPVNSPFDAFEQETVDTEENEDPSSDDKPVENSSSLYTAIANSLMEEGLLHLSDESKVESAEDLLNVFKTNFQNSINEYKESLDPRLRWLQDNMEQGVPLETLLAIDKDNLTYNSISEDSLSDNIDLQKSIVRDFYKRTTKFSDERINKEISRLDDLGELDSEAKSSLTELKALLQVEEAEAIQQAQLQAQQAQQAQQKALEDFKKTLESTSEIIPGLPLTNIVRDKVYKTMTTPVARDAYGNPINAIGKHRMENPLDFEFKLAYFYEVTNGFTDFSKLNSTGKKSAIKELEVAASRMDLQKSTGQSYNNRMPRTSNDLLKAMTNITI